MTKLKAPEEAYEPEPNSGCWIWIRARTDKGYGSVVYRGRTYRAHRLIWEQMRGPIPAPLNVLHKCDLRACVNPGHLFLGTTV